MDRGQAVAYVVPGARRVSTFATAAPHAVAAAIAPLLGAADPGLIVGQQLMDRMACGSPVPPQGEAVGDVA